MPAQQLLSELLQRGALESRRSRRTFFLQNDSDEASFDELRAAGLATCVDEATGSIAACSGALKDLGVMLLYHGPEQICKYVSSARSQDPTGSQGTVFDLLLSLLGTGWSERGLQVKSARLPPFQPGGEKILYYHVASKSISRNYLELSVQSGHTILQRCVRHPSFPDRDLLQDAVGCGPEQGLLVRPGQQARAYRQLMGLLPPPPSPADDVDGGSIPYCFVTWSEPVRPISFVAGEINMLLDEQPPQRGRGRGRSGRGPWRGPLRALEDRSGGCGGAASGLKRSTL